MEEHKELIWLAKNLKLEMTKYSRKIYGPGGFAHPGDDDDDDDGGSGGGGGDDTEMTLSYQLRKRYFQ